MNTGKVAAFLMARSSFIDYTGFKTFSSDQECPNKYSGYNKIVPALTHAISLALSRHTI